MILIAVEQALPSIQVFLEMRNGQPIRDATDEQPRSSLLVLGRSVVRGSGQRNARSSRGDWSTTFDAQPRETSAALAFRRAK